MERKICPSAWERTNRESHEETSRTVMRGFCDDEPDVRAHVMSWLCESHDSRTRIHQVPVNDGCKSNIGNTGNKSEPAPQHSKASKETRINHH